VVGLEQHTPTELVGPLVHCSTLLLPAVLPHPQWPLNCMRNFPAPHCQLCVADALLGCNFICWCQHFHPCMLLACSRVSLRCGEGVVLVWWSSGVIFKELSGCLCACIACLGKTVLLRVRSLLFVRGTPNFPSGPAHVQQPMMAGAFPACQLCSWQEFRQRPNVRRCFCSMVFAGGCCQLAGSQIVLVSAASGLVLWVIGLWVMLQVKFARQQLVVTTTDC
jgi:hypothetical protein